MEEKNNIENGLQRRLGLFSLTNIVVASSIGTGIFLIPGMLLADLQKPLLMIALWIVGGAIALCGALCYSELGSAFPKAGGETDCVCSLRPSKKTSLKNRNLC